MNNTGKALFIIILPLTFLAAGNLTREVAGSASGEKVAEETVASVTRIEGTLKRMDRVLDSLAEAKKPRANISLPRDPFTSLYPEVVTAPAARPEVTAIREEERTPDLDITGIVSGRKRMVIIENEVKSEGDFIGNYRIHKIEPDRVWLKDHNRLFAVMMHDK